MKRADDGIIFNEGGESSGLKKTRLSIGNNVNCGFSAINNGEEKRDCIKNVQMNSGQVEKNGVPFEDLVYGFDSSGLGGRNKSNHLRAFDLNSGLILDGEEEQKGFLLNLNHPPPQNDGIIDIASDDSDDDGVEIICSTYRYDNAKGNESEIGAPSDGSENLCLELKMNGITNIAGESSSLCSVRRFTREEKGKANVVDTWLSLKANTPPENIDHSSVEEEEDAETGIDVRRPLAARPEMAERAVRNAEQDFIFRENLLRETRKQSARRFARSSLTFTGRSNATVPSGQSLVKQLGNAPGPFADALRMVRERSSKCVPKKMIEWKPSSEIRNRSLFVPSLLDLALKALAANAEGIVSLEMVPDNLRERLTERLCDSGKMGVQFLKLLVEGCPTAIRVMNCSWLTEKQFQQAFGSCQTKDLRVLQLDLCGQCMFDFALKDIISCPLNTFSSLAVVSLRGACRLSDGGLRTLVASAPSLRSINLGQCSLLTSEAINFIADSLGSNLRELYIDDCQKINPSLILPAFKKFECLEVLSVAGLHGVTDSFMGEVIALCGASVKELDLADCTKLSDGCLKSVGSSCAGLCSLNISNLSNLTDLAMEYVANGCRSIRTLKMRHNGFSDEAMAAYIESSGESLQELLLNHVSKVGPNTALALAKRSRKLLSLDVSFCRGLTDEALGLIVDCCLSLKLLKVFGCTQITDAFMNGHSNRGVRIVGLKLGPILDHVNLLERDGVLLRYSPLSETQ